MTGPPPPPPPGGDPRYGAAGRPTLPGAPSADPGGAAPLDPLSNRLLWIAGLLGVLLVAVLANAALDNGEGGLNAVAQAAERTARMPGARVAMEVTYSGEGGSTTITGTGGGAYNAHTGRTEVGLSIPIPGHGTVTIKSVGDDRTMFLSSPMFAAELPPGKQWLGMEPLLGHSAETAFGSNGGAKSSIEMLKAVGGGVERVDQQTVRGHLTTRYRGSVELSRATQVLEENGEAKLADEYRELAKLEPDPMPVEVWVDEHGLARRIRLVQQLPTAPGGPSLTMDTRMELFDFGAHPKIKLPPEHSVFDMTPVLRAELHMLDGEAYSDLIEPQGPALTSAEFTRKGVAICGDLRREAGDLIGRAGAKLGKETSGFDLDAPPDDRSAAEVRAVARRLAESFTAPLADFERELLPRFAALVPPGQAAAAYHQLLADWATDAEARHAQALALQVGAYKVFDQLKDEFFSQDSDGEKALMRQVGLGACISDQSGGQPEASIE